jgi:hypothetical protein
MDGVFQSEKFVHIAAPGGAPVPGWTSESTMGAVSGTSQAAAYAAGVAASMLSQYPELYREPGQLKYRLQMCSYPLPAATPAMLVNPQRQWLSSGVIDPTICLLDPSKTWVKNKNGEWNSYDIRGWTEETLFLRGRRKIALLNDDVMRMIRTSEFIVPNTSLALFINRKDGDGSVYEPEGGLGQVGLVSAGTHSPQAGVILCDGTKLLLSDIDDIIVATERHGCPAN